jgi:hypothetical protein
MAKEVEAPAEGMEGITGDALSVQEIINAPAEGAKFLDAAPVSLEPGVKDASFTLPAVEEATAKLG